LAYAYIPSFSGGGDQENYVQSQFEQIVHETPYLEKTHHKKRAGGVAQCVGPEFKP
jgi:hypothetical protein